MNTTYGHYILHEKYIEFLFLAAAMHKDAETDIKVEFAVTRTIQNKPTAE
jgi:hypothetical protein